jgi:D-alanyl-D-alanine carboxypeptidase/D-alanyl-D-alanine-endopeptidase (penicillin-binding protein 4)
MVWMLAGMWVTAMPLCAQQTMLERRIAAMTAEPKVARDHWGIAVYTLDGRMIVGLNEGQLFEPASNAKLFTTAAALALLGEKGTLETTVIGRGFWNGTPGALTLRGNLMIVGSGDANLNGRELPYTGGHNETGPNLPLQYLEEMVDGVVANGLVKVDGDVVGDDTLFPWEPYPIDWAADDLVWGYGAPVSALTVNDNQMKVKVIPAAAGMKATIEVIPPIQYYTVVNEVMTGPAKHGGSVQFERALGSKTLRIYGTIATDAAPDVEEIAIQDPAEYAAIAFKAMLEVRGVVVSGVARAVHRVSVDAKGFQAEVREALPEGRMIGPKVRVPTICFDECGGVPQERTLAVHRSPQLGDDIELTNKVSQNLHAELLLRDLGVQAGSDGSSAQGVRVVRSFLLHASIGGDDVVLYDGSGMSGHDLVTPRATAKLLVYAATQPWAALYKSSLPLGGVDGTLAARFTKPPLKLKVWGKTGTNSEARALSGYVECASGQTVAFSVMVGNHPPGTTADREVMDRIVEAIAAAN